MIRRAWRTLLGFLGSTRLAIWLLGIVGVWSALATVVPQGRATNAPILAWAAAHPLIEPVVRFAGLHQAFSSPVFIACAVALAICTSACSWRRTKAASGKARTLRQAAAADAESIVNAHQIEIDCGPALGGPDALAVTAATLGRLGIRTRRRGDVLAAVSSPWSVWGSPVFHWSLVALIAVIIVSSLFRSEGLMGLAVGETKADVPQSYGLLQAGPLHDWGDVHRSIRVDGLDPAFQSGGIDRGPSPSVTVLDGAGNVIVSQRVYPNMTLKTGSLTIYPSDYGLAVNLALLNSSGVQTGSSSQLVDFSNEATDGTVPAASLSVSGGTGQALLRISVTVPLDRVGQAFALRVPEQPTAHVRVTTPDGVTVVDRFVAPDQDVALPSGDTLRVTGVSYYARLQVVDDWTTLLLYAVLAVAVVGLAVTVLMRQQVVLATVIDGPGGAKVALRVSLWRNAPSSRAEIETELGQALTGAGRGSST